MNLTWIDAIAIAVSAAVVYGVARLFGRPRGSAAASAGAGEADVEALRVVTRTRVGVGRTLVLVEVEGRRLLLGSTREQWSALADLGRVHASEAEAAYAAIDEELTRASEAARHRRLRS